MSKLRRFTQIFISIALVIVSVLYVGHIAFSESVPVYGSETGNAIDEDGLFKYSFYPYELSVAMNLATGGSIAMDDILLEERTINEVYIENMKEPVRIASVGSSRVQQMNSEIVGDTSFHNFGVSGGDFLDVINFSMLLMENGMLEEYLVIGLDPWILNHNIDAYSTKSNTELYSRILNEYMGYSKMTSDKPYLKNCRESLSFFFRDTTLDKPVNYVGAEVDCYNYPVDLKTAEGTVVYGLNYRGVDKNDIKMRALMESFSFIRMDDFEKPDPELVEIFNKFIDCMHEKDIKVVFMLVPYNPVMYDYVSEFKAKYPGFFMIEEWYVNYAKSKGIPIYGSYNPYVAGCEITDFYDGYHIKVDAMKKFMPQIDLIRIHEKEGRAASPYHLEKQPILKETALAICAERYPVEGKQVQRLVGDVSVFDKDCYQIITYSSDAAKAAAVGEYAVCKDNGAIYRKKSNKEWTYDFLYNGNQDRVIP